MRWSGALYRIIITRSRTKYTDFTPGYHQAQTITFRYNSCVDFNFSRRTLQFIPEKVLLEELEKVACQFDYFEFGWRDFSKVSSISATTIKNHFGSWKKGLEALRKHLESKGLELKPRPYAPNRIYSDQAMFDEMERIWGMVGQRPSKTEWAVSEPKISYNAYKRRFGSWSNACLKFIEYKMGSEINIYKRPSLPNNKQIEKPSIEDLHEIPLGLRLKVLTRDNFRCVFCGKSPAFNPGTVLHVDHIIPWSRGGKTNEENLQTLCLECNLGKGNQII